MGANVANSSTLALDADSAVGILLPTDPIRTTPMPTTAKIRTPKIGCSPKAHRFIKVVASAKGWTIPEAVEVMTRDYAARHDIRLPSLAGADAAEVTPATRQADPTANNS